MLRIVVAGLVGLLLGYLSANVLFVGQWISLVVWGLGALAVGAMAQTRRGALQAAALYGVLLVVAFLFTGYRGETALFANVGFLVLTAVIAVVAAVASAVAAWIAFTLRQRLRTSHGIPYRRGSGDRE